MSHVEKILGLDKSKREEEWEVFADIVEKHIREYTVPQYGDFPNDNASGFSLNDYVVQISKYATRLKNGGRMKGGIREVEMDFLKIAHYAGMAYMALGRAKKADIELSYLED